MLIGDDVLVYLYENEARGEVLIGSVPGPPPPGAAWRAGLQGVYAHAAHAWARWLVAVDPDGQRLALVQIWPRAALDRVTFGQQLGEQARQHRHWAGLGATRAGREVPDPKAFIGGAIP